MTESKATKTTESKATDSKAKTTKSTPVTYIMKVTHLAWGKNGKNSFYAKKKPLINAKVMGKYSGTLDIWLKNGWIEEGSY